jgi:hypothetical protein
MSVIGWITGFWCLLFVIIGAFQKPTLKVSSVWACGFMLLLLIQATISWGIKGLVASFVVALFLLLVTQSKYGFR